MTDRIHQENAIAAAMVGDVIARFLAANHGKPGPSVYPLILTAGTLCALASKLANRPSGDALESARLVVEVLDVDAILAGMVAKRVVNTDP